MTNNANSSPYYVNYGYQQEAIRPPPYNSSSVGQLVYPQPPVISLPQHPAETLPTPHTSAGVKRRWCKCVVVLAVSLLILLAVAALLLWYFLSYRCVMGQVCGDGTCISATQWCDGVPDCASGQDEAQCFRLYGSGFMLQAYSSESASWEMVCASGWDDSFGKAACEQIGYDRLSYVRSGVTTLGPEQNGYMTLLPGARPGLLQNSLHRVFVSNKSCSTGSIVTLRCIDCGSRAARSGSRIVGGQTARQGSWPWQVSLWADGQHLCGGSIITPQWIVTAAHCLRDYHRPSDWAVYAGYLTQSEMSVKTGNSVALIVSNDYDSDTRNNDIALMKLQKPLIMSDVIRPVCLPNAGLNFAAPLQCWISGWGSTVNGGLGSQALMEAQVSLIDRTTCNGLLVYNGVITDTMICAGRLQGGVDSCQGDSGGPLVTEQGSLWWLVGDTSWGIGCALRNKPGVYGNVTVFLNWIYEQMQKYK